MKTLQTRLDSLGLTHEVIAEITGYSVLYVSQIIDGKGSVQDHDAIQAYIVEMESQAGKKSTMDMTKLRKARTEEDIEQEVREHGILTLDNRQERLAWWTENIDKVLETPEIEDQDTVEILGCKVKLVTLNEDINYQIPRRKSTMPKDDKMGDYEYHTSRLMDTLEKEFCDDGIVEAAAKAEQGEVKYGRRDNLIRSSLIEDGVKPGLVRHIDSRGNFVGFLTSEQVVMYEKEDARWAKIDIDVPLLRKDMMVSKMQVVEYVQDAYVQKIKECASYPRIKAIIGDYKLGIAGVCWKVLMEVLGRDDFNNTFVFPLVREITPNYEKITEEYLNQLAEEKAIFRALSQQYRIRDYMANRDDISESQRQIELRKIVQRVKELRQEKYVLKLDKSMNQKYFSGFSSPLWDAVNESVWKKNSQKKMEDLSKSYYYVQKLISITDDVASQVELLKKGNLDSKAASNATYYAYKNKNTVAPFPYQVWKELRRIAG